MQRNALEPQSSGSSAAQRLECIDISRQKCVKLRRGSRLSLVGSKKPSRYSIQTRRVASFRYHRTVRLCRRWEMRKRHQHAATPCIIRTSNSRRPEAEFPSRDSY